VLATLATFPRYRTQMRFVQLNCSIKLTEVGMVMEVKVVSPKNALLRIVPTEVGLIIEVSAAHE